MEVKTSVNIGMEVVLAGTLSRLGLAEDMSQESDTVPVLLTENEYDTVNLVDSSPLSGLAVTAEGVSANAAIEQSATGKALIIVRLTCLDQLPNRKRLVLWAVQPGGNQTKIGQIMNSGHRFEAEIRAEIDFIEFELLATIEDTDSPVPNGSVCASFEIIDQQ